MPRICGDARRAKGSRGGLEGEKPAFQAGAVVRGAPISLGKIHPLLDELLAGYSKPEDLTGPDGLLKRLTGALVSRALKAEMTDHLGYEPHGTESLETDRSWPPTTRQKTGHFR